jgi:diguanylate cyclase (GGDEF)-like protein
MLKSGPRTADIPSEMTLTRSGDSETAGRHQMARFGALFFGGGAVVTGLGLLLPHPPEVDTGGLAIVAATSALIAAILTQRRDRLPACAYPLMPAAGTLLVSLALLFNGERDGGPAGGDEMYYLWVVLYSAYFLDRTAAAAQVAVIAVAYAATLAAIDPGPIGVSRWISTIGLVVGSAVVVHLLSKRIARLVDELELAARTDRLTGLPNRRAFEEHFEQEGARASRNDRPFSLLMADLDRFKEINDGRGHAAGDAALAEIGRVLQAELRENDIAARVGGDEFAILLPETCADGAREIGVRLAGAMRERLRTAGYPISLSFGVAALGSDGLTRDDLMRAADEALYATKRTLGAGRVVGPRVALAEG